MKTYSSISNEIAPLKFTQMPKKETGHLLHLCKINENLFFFESLCIQFPSMGLSLRRQILHKHKNAVQNSN